MSYELIAVMIFASMLLMLLTGQRVFAAIGGVATLFALVLWGRGASEMPFNASFILLNWYPLLTLPLFIYMGYMFSESGIASDLYRMFHVWMGTVSGGLAIGTIGLMVLISAMNGLSVAGMAGTRLSTMPTDEAGEFLRMTPTARPWERSRWCAASSACGRSVSPGA